MSLKDTINAIVALCLLCAGAASILVPVPEMPVAFALIVLAVLNRQRLNRPARIIGVIVMVLFFGGWAPSAAGFAAAAATSAPAFAARAKAAASATR